MQLFGGDENAYNPSSTNYIRPNERTHLMYGFSQEKNYTAHLKWKIIVGKCGQQKKTGIQIVLLRVLVGIGKIVVINNDDLPLCWHNLWAQIHKIERSFINSLISRYLTVSIEHMSCFWRSNKSCHSIYFALFSHNSFALMANFVIWLNRSAFNVYDYCSVYGFKCKRD